MDNVNVNKIIFIIIFNVNNVTLTVIIVSENCKTNAQNVIIKLNKYNYKTVSVYVMTVTLNKIINVRLVIKIVKLARMNKIV